MARAIERAMVGRMGQDMETGETHPLLGSSHYRRGTNAPLLESLGSFRGAGLKGPVEEFPEVPVGGHAGNDRFYTIVQLTIRVTVFLMLIGSLVWMPEQAAQLGVERFAKHAGLAACLMVFFVTTTVGGVLMTASAGVLGCFTACVNIFILRGFFPDGVTPGVGFTEAPSIVGWIDLAIFNFAVLFFNVRMGYRMTAMALNTSFMMCYLNPMDQTVFSKNFKINPKGAAVSAFVGVCLGSVCAVLAVLLPWPLGWASSDMKTGGMQAAQDTCKLFIDAVKYFKGCTSSVLIRQQLAHADVLKTEIGSLGAVIGDAYAESFDMSSQGTVRALFSAHATMLGEVCEILHALQIAMASEDFGASHMACMDAVGEVAHDLVDATSVLLIAATRASEDGDISEAEARILREQENQVTQTVKDLSFAFDDMRRIFRPVCKELMNESFFIFCLSSFARKTVDYSKMLRTKPPQGTWMLTEIVNSFNGMTEIPVWYHYRVVSRYWLSLFFCFLWSVHMDNYVPSCAITGVFLINTRVGPDVLAMIQGLLAVVIGIVTNAVMYNFSCRFGNTHSLMVISSFFWMGTILVGKGSSSVAGIGLFMAALSPFALFKFCEPHTPAGAAAQAVGLWVGIRALLLAVIITLIMEVCHIPGLFSSMATESLSHAFSSMEKAFNHLYPESNVSEEIKQIDKALANVTSMCDNADLFNSAAVMEPRLWKCPWKGTFLTSTTGNLRKVRLDVLLIKQALGGLDGKMDKLVEIIKEVPEIAHLKRDLYQTLKDAHELSNELLEHEFGKFNGLSVLDTVEGLDQLDGYDDAIESQSKLVKFPEVSPDSMEDDVLVRISIVYVMLQYLIQHVSAIITCGVELA